MTIPRFIAAATVVIVAALCTPSALVPGFNAADLIVIVAPIVLVVICLRPRRRKTPAGGAVPPNASPAGPTPTTRKENQ